MTDAPAAPPPSPCDACGSTKSPLLKMSLGRDFFGRVYDRLSPSADHSPKWYCETCSMHKNLQRDFRDIRAEHDKLKKGQPSELAGTEQAHRAHLRLREIATFLGGAQTNSPLLDPGDVTALLHELQARPATPSPSH